MCWLEDWKTLQSFGNQAFRLQRLDLARHYYLHSLLQLQRNLAVKLSPLQLSITTETTSSTDEICQLLICISISIQNLAEAYQQQQRWQLSQRILKRAQNKICQLQQYFSQAHPAQLVLLQESCRLRHEQCRHALDCHRCLQHSSEVLFEMASTAIH